MNDFSQRLRSLRGKRSQKDFADELGFKSQQTYANYERGRIPRPEILQEIAQQTGVTVDWLLNGKGPNPADTLPSAVEKPPIETTEHLPDSHWEKAFKEVLNNMPLDQLLDRLSDLIAAGEKETAQIVIDFLRQRLKRPP